MICPKCKKDVDMLTTTGTMCHACHNAERTGAVAVAGAATFSASGRQCPKCGKPMRECPKWPGLWQCVDYGKPINDAKPYRYKCTGLEITDEGVQGFDEACRKIICERN